MKNLTVAFIFAAISSAYTIEDANPFTERNHSLYFEPDLSISVFDDVESDSGTLRIEGQQYGIKVGYKYVKPNSIYTEISALQALGYLHGEMENNNGETFIYENGLSRMNASWHLGYTFQNDDVFSFIPFSGLGWSSWKDFNFLSDLMYIPFGMKIQFQIVKDYFFVGFNLERQQYLRFWERTSKGKASGNLWDYNQSGFEISLPFLFVGGIHQTAWHTSIEPYYLEPFTDLSIIGMRLAAARQF